MSGPEEPVNGVTPDGLIHIISGPYLDGMGDWRYVARCGADIRKGAKIDRPATCLACLASTG